METALRDGSNCLVLARRVARFNALVELLRAQGPRPLVLHGDVPAADRRRAIETLAETDARDAVLDLGTTSFIGEGFDAPALDTLVLSAPISSDGLLVQCAGRVVRAAQGKDEAIVHDYHDQKSPVLASSLERRMPGYRRLGFHRAT